MEILSFPDEALGNTSYLVVAGDAAVAIDPRRDADEMLVAAERLGARVEAVLETHLHADFVGGGPELADATGALVYASSAADLSYPHVPVDATVEVAGLSFEVLSTPGHTPEHVAYVMGDAVFSGGSLIRGGVARTDLSGAERTGEMTRAQFESVRRIAGLPDATMLYPTHGAGSFCSTGPARTDAGTIGDERATNPLLAIDDEETFVKAVRDGLGTYPTYFAHLREVNRVGAPLLRTLGEVPRIPASRADELTTRGAWLVDGRPIHAWAASHPQGAISNEVRPAFASWLGWVVPFGAPVVLVVDPDQVSQAARLARRIGYDRVEGWLTFHDWRDAGLPTRSIDLVTAHDAATLRDDGVALWDVRQRSEWEVSRVPGAVHVPLGAIIDGDVPKADRVVVYCGHGERSATAASLLARRGIEAANLDGGTLGWRRAGLPLET